MSTVSTIHVLRDLAALALVTSKFIASLERANAVIARAQAEGREITREEWDTALALDDAARARLDAEIAKAAAG